VNVSPFLRNLAILAVIALAVVVLNQETALATAAVLLRIAFFIAIAVVAYFFWRDFGRREIETWPQSRAVTFYCAVGLFVVDLGWWFLEGFGGLAGRDALAFVAVAAICVYVGLRTWRDQRTYS
jgi:small-conductance mechanosensitive channel